VIGTEQVLVGTEDVVVGTEDVEVGTENYVARVDQIVAGEEQVVTGTEEYVAGTVSVVTGTREVLDRTELIETGVIENVLIGFGRASAAPVLETADNRSRRPILEAVLALDSAIGRETADNPFAGLRGSIGLDDLTGIATSEDRDAALAKVRTALEAFAKSAAATPLATLIQADITLGQGTGASQLAYATTAAPSATLRLFA
jgi:hypothetical protein